MTTQKKLKKTIRARSRKTGESYTAARRQSEAGLIEKTGHGLDHWFAVLDAFDAAKKGHTASAAHLYEAHGVPGWHAQMVTVAYERERGLRAIHQTSAGDFQVSTTEAWTGRRRSSSGARNGRSRWRR